MTTVRELAVRVHVLECEKQELMRHILDMHLVIQIARAFKGYGDGPLSEPWTERVEKSAAYIIARTHANGR